MRNFNLKNFIPFIAVLLLLGQSSQAQDQVDTEPSFWSQVRFGGGIGLNAGNGFFNATLAPQAIYPVQDNVSLGVGLTGSYTSLKNQFNSTILGASILTLFNPINAVQLSGEYEQLHVSRNFDDAARLDDDYWYPALWLGGGYRANNVTIGVRYDVLYDDDRSVYNSALQPFARIFF